MARERQELYCTWCGKWVTIQMEMAHEGNHAIECPGCGHWHYRVVRDGVITEDRYDPYWDYVLKYYGSAVQSANQSYYGGTGSASSNILWDSWANTTSAC